MTVIDAADGFIKSLGGNVSLNNITIINILQSLFLEFYKRVKTKLKIYNISLVWDGGVGNTNILT